MSGCSAVVRTSPNNRRNNTRRGRNPRKARSSRGPQSSRQQQNRPNPVGVATDLRTTKRFEVILTALTLSFTVTPKALIDTIPGGSALWDKVQFHRFDIYGTDKRPALTSPMAPVTVTLNNLGTGGWFGDVPTYHSDPVGQFRRSHVGITPNAAFQSMWVTSSDTESILTITTSNIGSSSQPQAEVILQFTCTLRSTAGAPQASGVAQVTRVDGHMQIEDLRPHTQDSPDWSLGYDTCDPHPV
jgi:hypothetical protein